MPDPAGTTFVAVGRALTEAKVRERDLEQARRALRQSQKLEAPEPVDGRRGP
ncbi:hypothetical protein [Falsirhodobacter sp. 1013]|uniref:hypothetical protein n=1 Tax=Falsirhodobacter sp. 1013 TaxID=3417566 RepID=UPI003EC11397